MRKQVCRNQLKHQLFLHSKAWLAASAFSMVILSVYNIVVSWLLQKIIDIAAGNDPTSLIYIALVAVITFVFFMIAYLIYRTARPKFIQTAMEQYKASVFEKILDKKTHRLERNVLKEYDEIIVLHRGEAAERGTFDRLMDEHGLFYSLFTVSQ